MPYAVLEYSANIDHLILNSDIVHIVHDTMLNCGLFQADAVKTRARAATAFCVGTKGSEGSFAHVQVAILAGRTVEQRQALADALIAVLGPALPGVDQVTVDIHEMNRETYRKHGA